MFEATLSIDLGASYTKVAYRSACIPTQVRPADQEAKILMFDNSPLIPSLAIRTRNVGQPWIFGRQAALMNPDGGMQVFQNWKADLFRSNNDKDSATAVIIAHRFFEWLRSRLEDMGIDVRQCQTRVAMPAFDTFDENAVLLARCMDLSGWDNPTLILKVKEPHANTLGLFAGGRNRISLNGEGLLQPDYGRMWGQDNVYIRAARGSTLFDTHGNLLTVMIVDIGAFTTDLAALTFDVTASADGMSAIRQKSHELGVINQLDRPLFASLGERHNFAWSDLQFDEAESCKKKLYQGQPSTLLTRVDGQSVQLELGGAEDLDLIETKAGQFATTIWEKIEAFAADSQPSRVFLTGGGSLIQPVTESLKNSLAARQMRVGVVTQGDAAEETGDRRSWNKTGEGLQRLATALGGASVVLQEAAVCHPSPTPRQPLVTGLRTGHVTCRCQGGNKDCCFCGGRGFVFRA